MGKRWSDTMILGGALGLALILIIGLIIFHSVEKAYTYQRQVEVLQRQKQDLRNLEIEHVQFLETLCLPYNCSQHRITKRQHIVREQWLERDSLLKEQHRERMRLLIPSAD